MANSEPSIFTLIIQGEIPCHKVYEDEHVFAFLDINPCSVGHTLVVPKEQSATLDGLSDEASAAVGRVLPRNPELSLLPPMLAISTSCRTMARQRSSQYSMFTFTSSPNTTTAAAWPGHLPPHNSIPRRAQSSPSASAAI